MQNTVFPAKPQMTYVKRFCKSLRSQDDLQNRFTGHKLKKAIVIPHPDAESAESWQDVRQELQSKIVLKAKQIPRRGAE